MPTRSGTNPYIDLTNRSLSELGVVFTDACKSVDDILQVCSPDVLLHLHWPHRLYTRNSPEGAVLAPERFLSLLEHARENGTRVVWTMHNLWPHESLRSEQELGLRQALATQCCVIIVHGRFAAEQAMRLFQVPADQIHIVPHPDISADYPLLIDQKLARDTLGLSGDGLVLVMFGQLRRYKGIDMAIEALQLAPNQNWRLLIIGEPLDPEYAEELTLAASDDPRVTIKPGALSNSELALTLSAADYSLHCYYQILTSGAVALAQSLGMRVIAPRIGCLPEQITGGQALFYEPDDVRDLIATLELAERERDECRVEWPRLCLTAHQFAAKLRSIYESVMLSAV